MLKLKRQEARLEDLVQHLEGVIRSNGGERPSGRDLEQMIRDHWCRGLVSVPELQELSKKFMNNTKKRRKKPKKPL